MPFAKVQCKSGFKNWHNYCGILIAYVKLFLSGKKLKCRFLKIKENFLPTQNYKKNYFKYVQKNEINEDLINKNIHKYIYIHN